MFTWLEAHPVFYTMFFLPIALAILGGIFNAIARKRTPEEYAAMPQSLAGFLRLMSALFPDPDKARDAAKQMMKNAPPSNPTRSLQAGESVPPPTPRNDVPGTGMPLVFLLVAIGAVLSMTPFALCSCSPAANRTAQAEAQADLEITDYTHEVTKCRLEAREGFNVCVAGGGAKLDCKQKGLAQFDGCACGVDMKYRHDAGGICQ
jgi:hypothetical protein